MVTRPLRVVVGPGRLARSIAEASRAGVTIVLSADAFAQLQDELGSLDAAMRHLLRVATNVNRPVGVNFRTGEDTSSTAFVAPKGWSDEKLLGWIGGTHEMIEAAFGPATMREAAS